MAKSFDEMLGNVSPAVRKAALAKAERYKAEMRAADVVKTIRAAAKLGQREMADAIGVTQPAIAKMERQADIKLSTLMAVVKAAGGTLRIQVTLPKASITID
jgi:DNA-binding XRE family transcriptional regulator